MTAAPMRIVEETLRLDACAPEDVVEIAYSINGSWRRIGRVVLKRIKTLPKDRVQIKYHGTSIGSKVQKTDLAADLMVVRRRPAVEADGPDTGRIEPQTATVDGIDYVSTDPAVDIAVSIAKAVHERVPMLPAPTRLLERAMRGPLPGVDLLGMLEDEDARTVALVELLGGSGIWRG